MVIFGWGGGAPRDQGPALPGECPHCGNQTFFHYVTSTRWFRLYFIPLIPYSIKHFLLCNICTAGVEVHGAELARVKDMVGLTRRWGADQLTDTQYLNAVTGFLDGRTPSIESAIEMGGIEPFLESRIAAEASHGLEGQTSMNASTVSGKTASQNSDPEGLLQAQEQASLPAIPPRPREPLREWLIDWIGQKAHGAQRRDIIAAALEESLSSEPLVDRTLHDLVSEGRLYKPARGVYSVLPETEEEVVEAREEILTRPCPTCGQRLAAEELSCSAGHSSEPWTRHAGVWWRRDHQGDYWWCTTASGEGWIKFGESPPIGWPNQGGQKRGLS